MAPFHIILRNNSLNDQSQFAFPLDFADFSPIKKGLLVGRQGLELAKDQQSSSDTSKPMILVDDLSIAPALDSSEILNANRSSMNSSTATLIRRVDSANVITIPKSLTLRLKVPGISRKEPVLSRTFQSALAASPIKSRLEFERSLYNLIASNPLNERLVDYFLYPEYVLARLRTNKLIQAKVLKCNNCDQQVPFMCFVCEDCGAVECAVCFREAFEYQIDEEDHCESTGSRDHRKFSEPTFSLF